VDAERYPGVRSTADLGGLTIGVQQGNTSQPVADRLVAEGRAARVKVYAYGAIRQALADLTTGGCDAFMKLAPVTAWLVHDRPRLKVVETGITNEVLGICVRGGDEALRGAINESQRALLEDGTLARLVTAWLGPGVALATLE
jgi:polar amino acid transport system substrate-binding protein